MSWKHRSFGTTKRRWFQYFNYFIIAYGAKKQDFPALQPLRKRRRRADHDHGGGLYAGGLRLPGITAMGRHSLLIYLLHQPVIYGVLSVLYVL